MPLARFAAFHDVPESAQALMGELEFAVVFAHSRDVEVLVYNCPDDGWQNAVMYSGPA